MPLGRAAAHSTTQYEHSVGCFVIYAIAKTISQQNEPITVHSTFLDPFTGNGLIDWGYGEREFGLLAIGE